VIALACGALALPSSASAAPAHHHGARKPTAVVSLGDSYISGEAGRWKGNATTSEPGRLGTDRAWRPSATDPAGVIDRSLVYGDTVVNGCHRSDVAPIESAYLLAQDSINLACSGAKTVNVLRASAGGVAYKGEAPQDDQLAAVAASHQVKLVVLSIGGNDLGFGNIVTACVAAFIYGTPPCSTSQAAAVEAGLPKMAAAVSATVADIQATMADAGYSRSDYRLILQSYPSPQPLASRNRYQGADLAQRASVGGCPFLDADLDWAHTTLSPGISKALGGVATSRGVQYLDLTDAFHGHELCSSTTQQSTGKPRSETSEWIRFIDLTGQGDSAEALHPNYFGQKALGQCLTLATLTRRNVACHGTANLPDWAVYLT
jgi:hypothetical protein